MNQNLLSKPSVLPSALLVVMTAIPWAGVACAQTGPIVSAKSVNELIVGKKNVRVLDLGPKYQEFKSSHLPGAIFVDWIKDITEVTKSERYNLPTKKQFERLMGRCGVTKDTTLILYDDLNSRIAIRMFLIAKYYGHTKVQVLNGGKPAWINAKFGLSKTSIRVQPTRYIASRRNAEMTVTAKLILANLKNESFSLIDGRPVKQYTGEEKGKVFHTGVPHKKRGHIPGAVHIFWKDNFNSDGTFKSKDELAKLYEPIYRSGDKKVVTYCNEGLHAAVPWFVLTEILDKKNVSIYDDSMCEWANSDRPTELK